MSAPTKRVRIGGLEPGVLLAAVGMGTAFIALGTVWLGMRVDDVLNGHDATAGRDPIAVLKALVDGEATWSAAATTVAVAVAAVVLAAAFVLTRRALHARERALAIDSAAGYMGKGKEIAEMTETSVRATATRLGCTEPIGLPIGVTVLDGVPLFGGWEDVWTILMGPRAGKSTSLAIPAIVEAPGAVLATSNKRDLVDATRDVRAAKAGEPVWVFDPQQLVDEPTTWWWNPLTFVTDATSAMRLAKVFSDATRPAGARVDAYFDGAGLALLAGLLLAAAVGRRPITDVYLWVSDSTDDTPQRILAGAGQALMASSVDSALNLPEEQRAGVFDTARQIVDFMINDEAMMWVTPRGASFRREFDHREFVRSGGTLYSMSKEGVASAGPLVTAMNVAVMTAAEQYAKHLPNGRLTTPMVIVLDEAANVCRWSELPDLYSHFGSRALIVLTFLQSWEQGVAAWGKVGMDKLWGASTRRVVGSGLADAQFLDSLSRLIGDYERIQHSTSSSRGGGSTSTQAIRERILEVSDLHSMPRARSVVYGAGVRPTLVRLVPWWEGPHKAAIEASLARHDPKGGSAPVGVDETQGVVA